MEITIIGTGNMAPSRTRSTSMPSSLDGQPLDVFVASDDEGAKQTVAQLVESMGLRPVDAGPLRRARQLEARGYLHMAVQEPLGTGYGSTVKILA
jgi:hypothetical protein